MNTILKVNEGVGPLSGSLWFFVSFMMANTLFIVTPSWKSGIEETQEHLEECDFTIEMRKTLDLKKETDKLILWRRITHALKDLYDKKQIKM